MEALIAGFILGVVSGVMFDRVILRPTVDLYRRLARHGA